MRDKFEPVIGFEIHIELATKAKMFCQCSADHFQKRPNSLTCPVCLGLPGALPVPNKKAIEMCILTGLFLNCEIADFSKFDRKNYFYPDLAKGYQISQYDLPFCKNGSVYLENGKKVRIKRVHLEEDTAKLLHKKKETLIDFNRSGVPLMEIVTEPDLKSAGEAKEFLKKLQQMVRRIKVSSCNMEKGSMRCEVNISVKRKKGAIPKYKVEVKNLNSFRFVGKAIEYEVKRQEKILEKKENVNQETRGFDEKTGKTYRQRKKEEAADYRYFPEPDIPPIRLKKSYIQSLRKKLPIVFDEEVKKREIYLPRSYAKLLTRKEKWGSYYDKTIKVLKTRGVKIDKETSKKVANLIINKRVDIKKVGYQKLAGKIMDDKKRKKKYLEKGKVRKIIKKVLRENFKAVNDYKKGKEKAVLFLVGQVLKEGKGKIKGEGLKEEIKKMLKK